MRSAAAVLALVLGAAVAAPARADDVPGEDRRLDDLLFLVQAFDRGHEPLIRDCVAAAQAAGSEGSQGRVLRGLRDRAWVLQAERVTKSGKSFDEQRGLELWDLLSKEAEDAELQERGDRQAFEIELAQADRLDDGRPENEDAALAAYRSAAMRRSAQSDPRPFQKIGGLGLRQGKRLADAQEWDRALASYSASDAAIAQRLPASDPARKAFAAAIAQIQSTTGMLRIDWIGDAARLSRAPGFSDFRKGVLQLAPTAGQAAPRGSLALDEGAFRVLSGTYRASVLVGGNAGLSGLEVDVRSTAQSESGTDLELPIGIPAGMVYVPASPQVGAFLIDRTEVSRADFERWPGRSGVSYVREGDARHPARGMRHRDAAAYARSIGKELPTEAQWKRAAYGGATRQQRPYPWGGSTGSHTRHFHADPDAEGPGPVDGCASGASAFGLVNMAGNVWEWLADGSCIGGGFTIEEPTFVVSEVKYENQDRYWNPNMLWDSAPGPDLYGRMSTADKEQYANYSVSEDTLRKVGLRCVIPLPRR